jgi:hypothetical protein
MNADMPHIVISEIGSEASAPAFSSGSTAPRLDESAVMLRFRLVSADARCLEALRYARRAMLREEWTRGVEAGEPSLEEAVFTTTDVAWSVPAGAAAQCRATLESLVARANRALADLSAAGRASRRSARLESP